MIDLEEALNRREPSASPEISTIPNRLPPRSTRGLDVSSKYTQLLSKNTREEKTREINQQPVIELERKVLSLIRQW